MTPLSHRTVLAHLKISCWNGRMLDREISADVTERMGAERDSGLFSKRLLNKTALKEVFSVIAEARTYHKEHTRPWLESGPRILPTVLYPEVRKRMREIEAKFEVAVNNFAGEYPKHLKAAPKELGKMFKAEDYPDPDEITELYSLEYLILPLSDPNDFRDQLDLEDIKEIKRDLGKRVDEAVDEAMKDIGKRIASVVGNMATKLKDYKPKTKDAKAQGIFKDSLVTNVTELAALLPAFNLNDDPKLAALHKRIVKELCGTDATTLRDDDQVRTTVAKAAADILKATEAFMK